MKYLVIEQDVLWALKIPGLRIILCGEDTWQFCEVAKFVKPPGRAGPPRIQGALSGESKAYTPWYQHVGHEMGVVTNTRENMLGAPEQLLPVGLAFLVGDVYHCYVPPRIAKALTGEEAPVEAEAPARAKAEKKEKKRG